jgi:myosin heavy subunit
VEKKQLGLKEASEYHYLNQGKCFDVPNLDDVKEFEALRSALKTFGLDIKEQKVTERYFTYLFLNC